MPTTDEFFLREAIREALRAREQGELPFGAVLVFEDEIVHRAFSRTLAAGDPTRHAELSLISDYCRARGLSALEGYTLYASTEPCVMCAGAIHWAHLSRVVFSVPQALLQQVSGGRPKPGCESLINCGNRHTEVVGPLIPEEGMKVFDGYVFPNSTISTVTG